MVRRPASNAYTNKKQQLQGRRHAVFCVLNQFLKVGLDFAHKNVRRSIMTIKTRPFGTGKLPLLPALE